MTSRHHPPLTQPIECSASRRGFSLTELLVASTIALSVMAAVATLFGTFGGTASDAQSIVDMTNRMRMTASRLRRDLAGVTAPLRPPLSPDGNSGYFEMIEGPLVDATANATSSLLADVDDVLLFTTQSGGPPFQGRYVVSGTDRQIESSTAEVVWFCLPSPAAAQTVAGLNLHTLYRRQLLVEGYVGAAPFHAPPSPATNQIVGTVPDLFNLYDISLRPLGGGVFVPNTLGDLTLRQNRFLHGEWNVAFSTATAGTTFDMASGREGEDVVLTNVISFDVRVFDPDIFVRSLGGTILYPGDPDYSTAANTTTRGAFIDLGRLGGLTGLSGSAASKAGAGLACTYDTWSTAYEANGVDEDGDSIVDDATNGVDNSNPADGLPDDPGETETAPPYSTPLTAIEVRVRCYDPVSQQVRQTTIRHAFAN
jgi:prepilin-type N-terminal cleavage/methylation domain-containing protein